MTLLTNDLHRTDSASRVCEVRTPVADTRSVKSAFLAFAGAASLAVPTGTVAPVGQMTGARACHTATLLTDGRVLIAGGFSDEAHYLDSAERYDPATRTFTPLAVRMVSARTCPASARLRDGRILYAGGAGGQGLWLRNAELYDPKTEKFTATGSLNSRRDGAPAVLLGDGRVLVAGGYDGGLHRPVRSAEVYSPKTGRFTRTGNLTVARSAHTVTRLRDGRVLIAGGLGAGGVLRSADLYNPRTGRSTRTGSMRLVRHKHGAVLLANGNVLILGGSDDRDWEGRTSDAEIYLAKQGRFVKAPTMRVARFKLPDAVARLGDGSVLVAGGSTTVEAFNGRTFRSVEGHLDEPRFYSTTTALPDGSALIAGGYGTDIRATARAWLYRN
jgi:hypothetical protein